VTGETSRRGAWDDQREETAGGRGMGIEAVEV
jgi:hypothetical protein